MHSQDLKFSPVRHIALSKDNSLEDLSLNNTKQFSFHKHSPGVSKIRSGGINNNKREYNTNSKG